MSGLPPRMAQIEIPTFSVFWPTFEAQIQRKTATGCCIISWVVLSRYLPNIIRPFLVTSWIILGSSAIRVILRQNDSVILVCGGPETAGKNSSGNLTRSMWDDHDIILDLARLFRSVSLQRKTATSAATRSKGNSTHVSFRENIERQRTLVAP